MSAYAFRPSSAKRFDVLLPASTAQFERRFNGSEKVRETPQGHMARGISGEEYLRLSWRICNTTARADRPWGWSGRCAFNFCGIGSMLSDLVEALCDLRATREFVGFDLGRKPTPDEPMICRFPHCPDAHQLGIRILAAVNAHLVN